MTEQRYSADTLRRYGKHILISLGLPDDDADIAADSLVQADLEGAGSHGISRLPIYAQRIREGRITAKPNISVEQAGSVVKVDGGNGLGQVVASYALEAAIPVAERSGIAGVFVRGSNHFGTAAYYCQMACRAGMGLVAMTNSPPGIAPWGGRKAYFGTNPVAFGFPTRQEPPVIVDMSASVVARGKIILAAKTGQPIPDGWAMDEHGLETNVAAEALKGAVLPLGGAKGYALAMAVEIMTGVMSQAAFGPHVNNLYKEGDPPADVGHSFILMDISKWLPMEEYYARMEQFLSEIKQVPLAEGSREILYPGERRYRTYLENQRQGVVLPLEVKQELEQLGRECSVAFPG
jgi:LDH2 family malate/lactate/ureidoglycolate dehydrogenase